ncbi:MAG: preprotein translocase subunit SecE [Chloroflexota bacterium]|nr:preprotein translocase subunit SecE [Chloroflexota bacterium]MDE3193299.1 preprotein translocase subunit SecE [Chloroflexota bacterium]
MSVKEVGREQGGVVRFAQEAWSELAKVTWPTRETVIRFTVLVVLISVVIATYIWAFDNIFTFTITRGILNAPISTPAPVTQ